MYKYKVEIILDEEKIKKDDKYEPQVMYDYIRNMFKQFDLPEIKTEKPYHLIFTDKGRNRDYGALGKVMLDLYYSEWFLDYALKLVWYNYVSKSVEDVIKRLDSNKRGNSQWNKIMIHLNYQKLRNAKKP